MDPHADSTPGLALPQPSSERGAGTSGGHEPVHPEPEMQSVAAEKVPIVSSGAEPSPLVQSPVSTQPPPVAGMQTNTVASTGADDNSDALDEEWVNKAKAIVEKTKADPYVESKELSKAKADYLRIRYNKQIKVEDQQQ